MTTTIDTRGMFCPLPITFVSRKLRFMQTGTQAEILSDNRSFKRELESWCFETGNRLIEFAKEDGCYRALIQRGEGFHGDTPGEKIGFILLGVKVHLSKWAAWIHPASAPQYLLTFVSIAEGQRAHHFLKEQGFGNYRLLPVPNEIYPHCGLVFGIVAKENAVWLFTVLRDASFAVEDIHRIDRAKTFPKLDVALDDVAQ